MAADVEARSPTVAIFQKYLAFASSAARGRHNAAKSIHHFFLEGRASAGVVRFIELL